MSRHFLGVTRKGFGHARAGQSPRVESRGALDPPLESSCRPMSTPLNHGLEATPGQEPECNLAQHQKENLSAAVSPAKETTEGLIFTDRILKKKARDLNSRQEALDFFCCECPRKEARRGKYEVETNLTATHTGRKRRWAFQGEPPLGLPGGGGRRWRPPPPCLVPADNRVAPSGHLCRDPRPPICTEPGGQVTSISVAALLGRAALGPLLLVRATGAGTPGLSVPST